jgi:succinate dehydrogenase / fumarate reductase cytochrome b subunit
MKLFKLAATSIGKKIIMAVTGLLLSLFLITHAAGNATIFAGWQTFRAYAAHLHAYPNLIFIAEIILAGIFLAHISIGLLLFVENRKSRKNQYIVKSTGGQAWGSSTMPYSGIIILFFLAIHLFNVHFSNSTLPVALRLIDVFSKPWYVMFYTMALLALFLHISHGFWSFLQTLGFDHPKYQLLTQSGTRVLALLVSTVFILIPIVIFLSSL